MIINTIVIVSDKYLIRQLNRNICQADVLFDNEIIKVVGQMLNQTNIVSDMHCTCKHSVRQIMNMIVIVSDKYLTRQ